MNPITLECIITKNPDTQQIIIDHDTILIEPNTMAYFNLNSVGAKIWALLDHPPVSLLDIAEFLKQKFNVTTDQSIDDARQFIQQLMEYQMVTGA